MLINSPSIVRDGLLLYYDMSNTNKSNKGAPTTNYQTYPEASWNGSSLANVTYNYPGSPADGILSYVPYIPNAIGGMGVLQYVTGSTGYKYWAIRASGLPAGTYTMSYYSRLVSPTASSSLGNSQLWRMDGVDQGVSGDWNPTHTSDWKRWSVTGPITGPSSYLDFFPIHSGSILGGYTLQLCGFQLELGSYATPFVSGTRSNSQSILDLTGNYTLTASNMVYSSDGTFSFNGSGSTSSVITSSFPASTLPTCTIEAVIYPTKGTTVYRSIVQINSNSDDALYLYSNGSQMGFWPQGASSLTAPNDQWSYVAMVHTGTNINYFVNKNTTSSGSGSTDATDFQYIRIGSSSTADSESFGGKIALVRVYNRALANSEITQNYNSLRGRFGL